VTCAPQPATYPPVDASCSSYASAGVRLVRTWEQRRGGLQISLVDRWQSTDGQAHQLDAYYDQTAYSTNYAAPGHSASWNFPWTGDGFKSYPAQAMIAKTPSVPASYFVKPDASTPAGGDASNPIGAITVGTAPGELIIRVPAGPPNGYADWQERYVRTIPATGELKIEYVYSHDYSLASVQSMVADAEQALGGTDPGPAPGGGTPSAPAPSAAPPSAVAPAATVPPGKCVVPKLRRKTLRRSKILLRRAHCRLGRVTRKPSTRVTPGRVLTSRPRAGAGRPRGTSVRLVLAR
jgi:hypothetical protein